MTATMLGSETFLNRMSVLICEIALLACPSALLAQRGAHGTGAGRPSTSASNPAPSTSDMNDFNRAIALQATPEQTARFKQLTASTQAAKQQTEDLIHPENADKPDASLYAGLNDAVGEAQSSSLNFVSSFSPAQQSGLKPLVKKLRRANSDVSKESKALTQELARSQIGDKKIANAVEDLNRALTSFQSEQLDIGKEMGIQSGEKSQ
jgi:hypothetical protein